MGIFALIPMSSIKLSILIIACLAVSACAGNKPQGSRVDHNVITAEQLQENRFATVYDAVASLRSNWLQTRGTDSFMKPGQVLVYFDNTRMGGVEALRSISTSGIMFVRYYDGIAATNRWGVDHGNGVIYVSSQSEQ